MLTEGARVVGYETRGDGPPVVLLHAFPFSGDIWTDVAEALGARHRVVTVDARGFGATPLTGRYGTEDLADDLAAVLDQLDLPRATVLGNSMGGYTALAFALRHPARLAALVLADTRASADDPTTRAARDGVITRIRAAGAGPYLDGSMARLLSPGASAERVAFLRARAEARAESLIAGVEMLRDRPDRSGMLGDLRCPTLVLRGAVDQITPVVEMQKMAAAIPGASETVIPGVGHLPHIEALDPFVRALAAFLDNLDGPDSQVRAAGARA